MAEMKAFKDYKPAADACSDLAACRDEVLREIAVRKRLYDKWVAEGNMSRQEGKDRMSRLMGAMLFLDQFVAPGSVLELSMAEKPF